MKYLKVDYMDAEGDLDDEMNDTAQQLYDGLLKMTGSTDMDVDDPFSGVNNRRGFKVYWDPTYGRPRFYYWVFAPQVPEVELWLMANAPTHSEWIDQVPQELLDAIHRRR